MCLLVWGQVICDYSSFTLEGMAQYALYHWAFTNFTEFPNFSWIYFPTKVTLPADVLEEQVLTGFQPIMTVLDFGFQQSVPASAAKKALLLTHSEAQAICMCLICEFPSPRSSFSTNTRSSGIGSNQVTTSLHLLRGAEMVQPFSILHHIRG